MSKHLPKITKALTVEYRRNIVEKLIEQLREAWVETGETTLANYITQLEICIYEKKYILGSLEDYRSKIRSLKFNLKYNGTTLFIKYSPDELIDLTSAELGATSSMATAAAVYNPIGQSSVEESKPIPKTRDAYEISSALEELDKNVLPNVLGLDKEKKSMLVCFKCGPSGYVKTHSRQTRSADEGETTFAECTKCGNKWKQ
jgi:DNA-directed RNA polymerase subunit M/transcription elongation factor TFIIS